jgi:hypothetical protein
MPHVLLPISSYASIDPSLAQASDDISATEAISHSANLLHTQLFLQALDSCFDDRLNPLRRVCAQPSHHVKWLLRSRTKSICGNRVAVEDVRDDGSVTRGGEVICETNSSLSA